jgi:hypothetical protein
MGNSFGLIATVAAMLMLSLHVALMAVLRQARVRYAITGTVMSAFLLLVWMGMLSNSALIRSSLVGFLMHSAGHLR